MIYYAFNIGYVLYLEKYANKLMSSLREGYSKAKISS